MLEDLAFTDERNGIVYAVGEVGLQKMYITSDGARTWKSVIASPASRPRLYFADPEVGWSIGPDKLLYTTNGGKRWTAVAQRFPSYQIGVSFPRRDRAYVVGDHGMVLRYRVPATGEKALAGAKPAPAMPPYVTPLETEAAEVLALLESVQPQESGSTDVNPQGGDVEETAEEIDETATGDAEESSEVFAGSPIATPKLKKLDLLLTALGSTVPSFLDRFTNLNLLAARLRTASDLPGRLSELKAAIGALKKASDAAAADAALAQAFTAAQQLHTVASVAVQKQLPASTPAAASGATSAESDEEVGEESEEVSEESIEE
jgi:hypothetical protein